MWILVLSGFFVVSFGATVQAQEMHCKELLGPTCFERADTLIDLWLKGQPISRRKRDYIATVLYQLGDDPGLWQKLQEPTEKNIDALMKKIESVTVDPGKFSFDDWSERSYRGNFDGLIRSESFRKFRDADWKYIAAPYAEAKESRKFGNLNWDLVGTWTALKVGIRSQNDFPGKARAASFFGIRV
jgi:hypothetical protein